MKNQKVEMTKFNARVRKTTKDRFTDLCAEFGFSKNRKGELTPRIVSLSTAKSVFELYEAEIKEHNSKFND